VRDIYIGTLEGFDAKGFPPADYIALGHIHRPQKVAKTEHIRYSGSPIPLSFDELNTQKQVVLVSFDSESTTPTISTLPVPRFQAMEVIKGDLKTIEEVINKSEATAVASLTDDDANNSVQPPVWLCIEVETEDYLTDLQQRIQGLLAGKNAEILQLKRKRKRTVKSLTEKQNVQLSELSVNEVFEARLALETIEENPGSEKTEELLPGVAESDDVTDVADSKENTSRIDRIRLMFNEAVERVNTNDEDADVSGETSKAKTEGYTSNKVSSQNESDVSSVSASESEQDQVSADKRDHKGKGE